MIKRICVVGLGYVGLPTALAFAESGYEVVGADIKAGLIERLGSGKSTIPEIIEDARIADPIKSGKISFTADTPKAVSESDAILITVPTPVTEDKKPDLRAVRGAAESIAEGMSRGKLVVLESTVYPGATEEIVQKTIEDKTGLKAGPDFGLAYCPERYNPGDKEHTLENLRRVVGAIDQKWLDTAAEMYSKITRKGVMKVSSVKTAEAAKVIENTQRDLNIGLMNELAVIFDRMGIDTREVVKAASTKWNFHVYWPGPGVGGHCFDEGEFLFVKGANGLQTCRISDFVNEELNNGWEKETLPNGVSLVFPKGLETLSFDLDAQAPCYREIKALSKRPYSGKMLTITTEGGRVLKVSDKHPMIVYDDEFYIRTADKLAIDDRIPISTGLPELDRGCIIDLIETLPEDLARRTRVKPKKKAFREYKSVISKRDPIGVSDFSDFYGNNSMPLWAYLELERQGKMPIGRGEVFLCTGRGPSYNQIPAIIDIDEEFARLLGYYLSEGCITKDKSLRTRFTFNTKEKEYINDLKTILGRLGIKYSERQSKHWASYHIKVSSNIFGHLLRDVLECGVDCYTMAIPGSLLASPFGVRRQLLAGLLRGDGGVYYAKGKRKYTKGDKVYAHRSNCADVSYYSSSPVLHQQVIMLLQSFGYMPTLKPGTAHMRVHGRDAERMAGLFDGEKRQKLAEYSGRKLRYSSGKVFRKHGEFATVRIKRIEQEPAGVVYSLEVDGTNTLVTTGGIITHNCLPVDPYYLVYKSRELGFDPKLITAGREINDFMAVHTVNLAERALKSLKGKKVAVLGAAYKGNVGDARETPAKRICAQLRKRGAQVVVCDPLVKGEDMADWGVEVAGFDEALKGSDCIIIHTDHDEFKALDLGECARLMRTRAIVDTRGLIDPEEASKRGFSLERI